MAKRARGSTRPGQRRPIERRSTASAPAANTLAGTPPAANTLSAGPRAGLTDAEAARAAQLEAALVAQERAAEQARTKTRDRGARALVTPGGSLARRAEEEYAYVSRDIRDIARIFLIDVTKVIPIGG